MNRLYYKYPYLSEFRANIKEIIKKESKCHMILDKTAFFPGGGGQISDIGYIEDEKVIEVYEFEGEIYHVLEQWIGSDKINVECKIDWKRRFDGMQQHLGQHVLSGCFFKEFNQNTVSFHMGKESSTVDIKGEVDKNKIEYIEKVANEIVFRNLEVKFFIPSKEELKNIKLRREIPLTDKDISVVEIKGLDINACCGLHLQKTLELQLIKVVSFKKNKDCTRIEFLVGKRVIDYMLRIGKINENICNQLTCGEADLLNTINKIILNNRSLLDENKKLKNILNNYMKSKFLECANRIKGISVLRIMCIESKIVINDNEIQFDGNVKNIISVAKELVNDENAVILIGNKEFMKSNLIFMKSNGLDSVDIELLFRKSIKIIEGKGGGNKNLMQGSGKSEKIEEALKIADEYLNLIISNI